MSSRFVLVRLRLYIAGDAPNSLEALANLKALCEGYLPGRHQVEVVDVLRDSERALADNVFMTPTLLRLGPLPVRRVVGTLSQPLPVLQALGLDSRVA